MMKNIILILILLITHVSRAQEIYQRFLVEGKSWQYSYMKSNDGYWHPLSLSVKGDTIVNGLACFKVYINDDGNYSYFAAAYERDKRVWCYSKETDKEILWFDFSKGIGDSLVSRADPYPHHPDLHIINIDTIEVANNYFRRQHYYYFDSEVPWRDDCDKDDDSWLWTEYTRNVEGIGFPLLVHSLHPSFEGLPTDYYLVEFIACYDGDECIFAKENFMKEAFHAQTTSFKTIKSTTTGDDSVYNLSGQRMVSAPRKDISIRNGKKYVVK